jgi:hypothetical protein
MFDGSKAGSISLYLMTKLDLVFQTNFQVDRLSEEPEGISGEKQIVEIG